MTTPKKVYQAPAIRELGDVASLTKESGWGLAEWLASIISTGTITPPVGGACGDSAWNPADCFS